MTSDLRVPRTRSGVWNILSLWAFLHGICSCIDEGVLGSFRGLPAEWNLEDRDWVWKFGSGADNGSVSTEHDIFWFMLQWLLEKMLPIHSQLRDCSQWASGTLVQSWNSGQQSDIKCQVLGFPGRKQMCQSRACEMMVLEVPSMGQSLIGGMP